MTYSKEKSIVNCAGKCNVSAKETMPKHSSIIIRAQALSMRRCGVSQKVVAANYGISVKTLRHWEGNFCQTKKLVWGAVFRQNHFSRLNCQLLPKACNTYSESFPCRGSFEIPRTVLVHLSRHQNFAGKLHIRSYNIWDCVVTQMESLIKNTSTYNFSTQAGISCLGHI